MPHHTHDDELTLALLKSVAASCEETRDGNHVWRRCRHCLAIVELDPGPVRTRLRAFLEKVERILNS